MIDLDFSFRGELWQWKGDSWHFITVPGDISADIKAFTKHKRVGPGKGFGSVRVKVIIAENEWLTSLFPDKKSGCYFLPMKAAIRKKLTIVSGDECDISISVLA